MNPSGIRFVMRTSEALLAASITYEGTSLPASRGCTRSTVNCGCSAGVHRSVATLRLSRIGCRSTLSQRGPNQRTVDAHLPAVTGVAQMKLVPAVSTGKALMKSRKPKRGPILINFDIIILDKLNIGVMIEIG